MNAAILSWVLVSLTSTDQIVISTPMTETACKSILDAARRLGPTSKWRTEKGESTLRADCVEVK